MLYLLLAALLTAADQLIKAWAQQVLRPAVSIDVIPGVLSLYYHENFGAAWGILQGQRWLLLGVTGLLLAVLLGGLLLGKFRGPLLRSAVALILAGGLGNLLDRALHEGGFVVDYIYFELINFPIFNLADICVCVGTGLLALYILFVEGRRKAPEEGEAPAAPSAPPEEEPPAVPGEAPGPEEAPEEAGGEGEAPSCGS